jgi:hypothetical protein
VGWSEIVHDTKRMGRLKYALTVPPIRAAVQKLASARDSNAVLRRNESESAVGFKDLIAGGSSEAAISWLLENGAMIAVGNDSSLVIAGLKNQTLALDSEQFALSELGTELANMLSIPNLGAYLETPTWNESSCELFYRGELIKRFVGPAENQVRVLTAFQLNNWAEIIASPWYLSREINSRKRLLNAVQRLNGIQLNPRLRFHVCGGGKHVRWNPI